MYFSIEVAISVFYRYIHSMNLAHLDIKPGNIFLSHERGLDTSMEDFVSNGKEAEEQKMYKIGKSCNT